MTVQCGVYGSDTWKLDAKTQNPIWAGEMRFLRLVLAPSRRGRLRNDNIRNVLV